MIKNHVSAEDCILKTFLRDIFILPKRERLQKDRNEKLNTLAYYGVAFLLPLCTALLIAVACDIAPFGEKTLMAIDAWGQYFPMLREMKRAFRNFEFGYSFSGALGFDLTAQSAYYTNSPLWIILFLLPGELTPSQVDIMVFVRFALASLTFTYFLSEHYSQKRHSMLFFSLAYAFSGYTLAFINQFMWMDAVVLLPLVLLGIERICDNKGYVLYTVSLFLTIYSNFYIAFAVCIFSVIWFFLKSLTEFDTVRGFFVRAFRFGFCSLFAGVVNLHVLVPLAKAIGNTLASSKGFGNEFKFYHPWSEVFEKLLPFGKSSLAFEAPNIYFGFVCAVLCLVALVLSKANAKKKIGYSVVVLFMLLSFNFNLLDYIWHGLHFPNQLPGRQSFLFAFVCLVVAFAGYDALIDLIKHTKVKNVVALILALLIGTEITANAALHFAGDTRYVSNKGVLRNEEAIDGVLEKYSPDTDNNEFYRTELASPRYNGGQLYGYYGVSHYSSTMSGDCYNFFLKLGMDVYAKNVSTEYLPNPVLNSIFGVKYIMSENAIPDETSIVVGRSGNLYVHENTSVLPCMWVADKGVLDIDMTKNGYAFQNEIFTKAAACSDVISGNGIIGDNKKEGYILNTEEFNKGIQNIKANKTEITFVDNNKIEGIVTAVSDGVLVLSFPYSDCTVFVDGEKAETLCIAGYLGGVRLQEGTHEITVKFG